MAYIVRAVAPGRYIHPPALVEDMYAPERFGRTASARSKWRRRGRDGRRRRGGGLRAWEPARPVAALALAIGCLGAAVMALALAPLRGLGPLDLAAAADHSAVADRDGRSSGFATVNGRCGCRSRRQMSIHTSLPC